MILLLRKTFWRRMAVAASCLLLFASCATQKRGAENSTLDGENLTLIWSYASGGAINHPPIVAGENVLFVPHAGTITALDAVSGKLRWQFDAPTKVWERAYATDGERVFVGLEGGALIALDAATGDLLWEVNLGINVDSTAKRIRQN